MNEVNTEMQRRTEAGYADIKEWFERLEEHREPESTALTEELLKEVGYAPLPKPIPEFANHGAMILAKGSVASYGVVGARQRSAMAYANKKDLALSSFWTSVSEYLGSL